MGISKPVIWILDINRDDLLERTLKLHLPRQILFAAVAALPLLAASTPSVGDKAPNFSLASAEGRQVKLSDLISNAPVALVVLRGFPGYQCPFCQRQVQDFVQSAKAFADAGVQVVFVYPGSVADLDRKANEFLSGKDFPKSFLMLLDPGYAFTNLYGLRWNEPRETAYPSTFLLDRSGIVFYAQTARLHSGRTSAAAILEYFKALRPPGK